MKLRLFLIPVFCLIMAHETFSQLSGVYTIGTSGCDYGSVQEAVLAIINYGTNGNVVFKILTGTYDEFSINGCLPPGNNDTVSFVSITGKKEDVIFHGSNLLYGCRNLKFANLTFITDNGQSDYCFKIQNCSNILVDSCSILDSYQGTSHYGDAVLTINPFTSTSGIVEIRNTKVFSRRIVVQTWGEFGSCKFTRDTVIGYPTGNFRALFRENVLDLDDPNFPSTLYGTFYNNSIKGNSIYISGNCFGNDFDCYPDMNSIRIEGNHFHKTFNSSNNSGVRIIHNIFDSKVYLFCLNTSKISRNTFRDYVDFDGENCTLSDNFFLSEFKSCNTANNNFIGNSFGYGSTCIIAYTDGSRALWNILNNTFYNLTTVSALTVSHNNFIPDPAATVNYKGVNAFFYDPQYVSDEDLHATNPALIHKGIPNTYTQYDIDSLSRPGYPSIGANEICFAFDQDTIVLSCDSLCLKLCQNIPGSFWSPSSLFPDPYSTEPVIYPHEDVRIYLNDPSGVVDSVFVRPQYSAPVALGQVAVDDLEVRFINSSKCADSIRWIFGDGTFSSLQDVTHIYLNYGFYDAMLVAFNNTGTDTLKTPLLLTCLPQYLYIDCGDTVHLTTCMEDFTGFYWSPSWLFPDTTDPSPSISITSDELIFLSKTGYPNLYSIQVWFYPEEAQAAFTYSIDSLTVVFQNESSCGSYSLWDFGDGVLTEDKNPVHSYASPGDYVVTLISRTNYDSDTAYSTISITDIQEISAGSYMIRPNPVSDYLIIEPERCAQPYTFKIFDQNGKIEIQGKETNAAQKIDIRHLARGIYFLQITDGKGSFVRKVITAN